MAFRERRDGVRVYPDSAMLLEGYRRVLAGLGEATIVDHERVRRALAAAAARAEDARPQLREQLATTSTRMAEAEVKLDRYFEAFESGAMPKDACGPRIAALSAAIERLRTEACALEHDLDASGSEAWTDQDLADLEETVRAEAAVEAWRGAGPWSATWWRRSAWKGAADVSGPSSGFPRGEFAFCQGWSGRRDPRPQVPSRPIQLQPGMPDQGRCVLTDQLSSAGRGMNRSRMR